VIIKLLFAVMVLSLAALVGVAVAVFVRVWWHLKSRRAQAQVPAENAPESNRAGSQEILL